MNKDWCKLKAVYDFAYNKPDDPFADVEILTDKYKIFFASKNEKMRLSVIREKSTFLDEVRIANMAGVELNNITVGSISTYESKPSIYGVKSKSIFLIPSQLLLNSIKGEGKNYFADEMVIFFIERRHSGYNYPRGYISIALDPRQFKNMYGNTLTPIKETSIYMNVRVETA